MRKFWHTVMVLGVAAGLAGAPAHGQTPSAAEATSPLVVDLSDDLIAITTGFTGTEVLLFGATAGAQPSTESTRYEKPCSSRMYRKGRLLSLTRPVGNGDC